MSRDVTFDERGIWNWSIGDLETAEVTLNYQQEENNYDIKLSSVAQDPQTELTGHPRLQRQMPARLQNYVITLDDIPSDEDIVNFALFADYDPVVYEKAASDDRWVKAMEEEIHAIEKNDTWELTSLPIGKKAIGVKWVYMTKFKLNREVDRYNARLVVKGCKQKFGIDYFEVFALVARLDTSLYDNFSSCSK